MANSPHTRDKAKQAACAKRFREKNREKVRAAQARYEADNTEKINARRMRRREISNASSARRRLALKVEVFAAYGGAVCACCGETEFLFLSIDHVENDGAQHRREVGGSKFYNWLKSNGYPQGFQVLCQNCNRGKWLNGGICPHKDTATGPRMARTKFNIPT